MSESDLRTRVAELMAQAREELSEIVAIRSVADPRQFPPEECLQAATWVADRFAGVGFDDIRLAETPDGSSAVIGRDRAATGTPPRCCSTPITTCSPL
jgi:acetylornithine deacetylase/succinyl-diaminopimelate desuccinylase-like protein